VQRRLFSPHPSPPKRGAGIQGAAADFIGPTPEVGSYLRVDLDGVEYAVDDSAYYCKTGIWPRRRKPNETEQMPRRFQATSACGRKT
jgi:hypothetical protein